MSSTQHRPTLGSLARRKALGQDVRADMTRLVRGVTPRLQRDVSRAALAQFKQHDCSAPNDRQRARAREHRPAAARRSGASSSTSSSDPGDSDSDPDDGGDGNDGGGGFRWTPEELESFRQAEQLDKLLGIEYGPPAAGVIGDSDGLIVRTASLDRARPPRWAWQHRIVLGYLNLLLGNEGVGKGTLIAWLIARLTGGDLPGDLLNQPVAVGVLGDEDSFDDVWTPRLHAAGADLSMVVHIERPDRFVHLREDRDRLAAVIQERGIGLLYLDQLLDNLGVGVNDWRQKEVRDALQPARSLAGELGIGVLGSLHPNKRAASFRELVAGAPAFNAVARSSLLLADHPENEGVRVLVRGKGNLSQTPAAVEFAIAGHRFKANGHEFDVPLAQDFHTGDLTVDDLLIRSSESERSDADEAADWLQDELADGGWHEGRVVKAAAQAAGISDKALRTARERLGVGVDRRAPEGASGRGSAVGHWRLVVMPSPSDGGGHDNHGHDNETPVNTDDSGSSADCRALYRIEGATTLRRLAPDPDDHTVADLSDVELRSLFPSEPVCGYRQHVADWVPHPDTGRVICWTCHPPAAALIAEAQR